MDSINENTNFMYKIEWPEYTQTMNYSNFDSTNDK